MRDRSNNPYATGFLQRPPDYADKMAREWMEQQTARLGITSEEILDAVRRGWFGEDIAALPLSRVGELSGPSPRADKEHRATLARIRNAPIVPVDFWAYAKARDRFDSPRRGPHSR